MTRVQPDWREYLKYSFEERLICSLLTANIMTPPKSNYNNFQTRWCGNKKYSKKGIRKHMLQDKTSINMTKLKKKKKNSHVY